MAARLSGNGGAKTDRAQNMAPRISRNGENLFDPRRTRRNAENGFFSAEGRGEHQGETTIERK